MINESNKLIGIIKTNKKIIGSTNIGISGGSGGNSIEEIHVGPDEPIDNNIKLWIDTDENPEDLDYKINKLREEFEAKYLTLDTLPIYDGGVE